jgi:glutamyl-tRNA synthetase
MMQDASENLAELDLPGGVLPEYAGLPKPVTRFAPSPTGYLHIGGARTALFNLLYARHHGGSFLLRIEDTDRARSTDDAIAKILDGMAWLGMEPDRPPLFQFARVSRHAEVAHALLAAGRAYRCYATPDELEAMREVQKAQGLPQRYDGRWRERTDWPEGKDFVVRLKAPTEGETVVEDRVQGTVRQANAELDDFVLLRSDGTPTYMLAVVVDDHDMGVSHVIRGDDHLTNTFRQLALIRALGWPEPIYAHVPMIHGPDGAKLSKRHGALGVEAYRDELGVLPEALENYLLRLGWGHGDTELVTRAEAISLFDLDGVGRSPGRFDLKKLESVNAHYLKAADNDRLVALVAPRMAESLGRELDGAAREVLLRSMDELKPRAKNLNDLAASALFLVRSRPLAMDEGAAKLLDPAGLALLAELRAVLAGCSDWSREALEAAAKAFGEARGLGLGKVAGPLRSALTGQVASPSVFAVMAALGRDECLGRIDDATGR